MNFAILCAFAVVCRAGYVLHGVQHEGKQRKSERPKKTWKSTKKNENILLNI